MLLVETLKCFWCCLGRPSILLLVRRVIDPLLPGADLVLVMPTVLIEWSRIRVKKGRVECLRVVQIAANVIRNETVFLGLERQIASEITLVRIERLVTLFDIVVCGTWNLDLGRHGENVLNLVACSVLHVEFDFASLFNGLLRPLRVVVTRSRVIHNCCLLVEDEINVMTAVGEARERHAAPGGKLVVIGCVDIHRRHVRRLVDLLNERLSVRKTHTTFSSR
jgi:hypothetical protein